MASCATQPAVGSCIQAAVAVAGTLLAGLGGEEALAAEDAVDTVEAGGPVGRTLFRRDTRDQSDIFSNGFTPKGNNMDLRAHVRINSFDSGYVATSKSLRFALSEAQQNGGFVYQVRADGIDVNATFGADSPFPWEHEIAVPRAIPPEDIVGVTGPDGEFTPNPGFKP